MLFILGLCRYIKALCINMHIFFYNIINISKLWLDDNVVYRALAWDQKY